MAMNVNNSTPAGGAAFQADPASVNVPNSNRDSDAKGDGKSVDSGKDKTTGAPLRGDAKKVGGANVNFAEGGKGPAKSTTPAGQTNVAGDLSLTSEGALDVGSRIGDAGGKSTRLTSLASVVDTKDLVATKASTDVLALFSTNTHDDARAPSSDPAVALAAFSELTPLLGTPNGKGVADAFAFDWISALADLPATSPQLLQVKDELQKIIKEAGLTSLSSDGSDDPTDNLSEGLEVKTNAGRLRKEMQRNEKLANIVETQFYALLQTSPENIAAHTPSALMKTIETQLPALIKALKQQPWVKGTTDESIVIASTAEVEEEARQVEAAFGPIVGQTLHLAQRMGSADTGMLAEVFARLQAGKSVDGFPDAIVALARELQPLSVQSGASSAATSFAEVSSGLDFTDGDLMSLVHLVMMKVAKTNGDILRDVMAEMQEANRAKAAKREQVAALTRGQTAAKAAATKEFRELEAAGQIGAGWKLDDWLECAQVAWGDGRTEREHWVGPDPEAVPLDVNSKERFRLPRELPKKAGAGEPDAWEKWGLTATEKKVLEDLWNTAPFNERLRATHKGFNEWVATLGFKNITPPEGKEIGTNLGILDRAVNDTKALGAPRPIASNFQDADFGKMRSFAMEYAWLKACTPPLPWPADRARFLESEMNRIAKEMPPDKAKEFCEWRKGPEIRDYVRNKGNDLGRAATWCLDTTRRVWEGDKDRNVMGFQIVNGEVQMHIYDDEGGSDDVTAWRSWHRLFVQDEQVSEDYNASTPRGSYNRASSEERKRLGPNFGMSFQNGGEFLGSLDEIGKMVPHGWVITEDHIRTIDRRSENADLSGIPEPAGVIRYTDQIQLPDSWTNADDAHKAKVDYILNSSAASASKNQYGEYFQKPSNCDEQAWDMLVQTGMIKFDPERTPAAIDAEIERRTSQQSRVDAFEAHAKEVGLNRRGSYEQLSAEIEAQKGQLDTLGDLTTMVQMRLQKYLDSYTKCFEMLSNIMKKMADTSGTIAKNMT